MKLSTYDLVAMQFRSFDYKMENFIDEITSKNASIGIDQDVLIKLLLILNDRPTISITELNAKDAKFATDKREHIEKTLAALKRFLRAADNEKWFEAGGKSAIKRSAIPLYFLAYHIFHQTSDTIELQNLFNQFDVSDRNFKDMSLWLKLSLLNQVFRRGSGWSPDKTCISKIHEVMSKNKGKDFPIAALFGLYRERLHRFIDEKAIVPSTLDLLDQEYVFYMMYNGTTRSSIRFEDKDHIQPRSLLQAADVDSVKINSIGNLQLIDSSFNRGRKNDKPLVEWLKDINDKPKYLERHLIPNDPNLWEIGAFEEFREARLTKIADKIKSSL